MINDYHSFLNFLQDNIRSENELDFVIYNIGVAQRITEQFGSFYSNKIQKEKDEDESQDNIDLEVVFENEVNRKIHLALTIGDEATWFVECEYDLSKNTFFTKINKELIAKLTLVEMRK